MGSKQEDYRYNQQQGHKSRDSSVGGEAIGGHKTRKRLVQIS